MLAHANMFIDSKVLIQLKSMGAARVSFFFFISGYGLMYSFMNKGQNYLSNFFNKRILYIIKPFLLINIIFTAYIFFFNNGLPDNFFDKIVKGTFPVFTSWYIAVLTVQYVLFLIIFKISRIKIIHRINTLALLTVIEILFLYSIKYDRCWWVSTIAFPVGMYYRYYMNDINRLMSKRIYKLFYMPIGCVLVGILLLLKMELLYTVAYIIIPLLIIIPICFFKDRENGKIIKFLNSISYEIYLVHIVVFSVFSDYSLFLDSNLLFIVMSIIVTIICSYIFKFICNLKLSTFIKNNKVE